MRDIYTKSARENFPLLESPKNMLMGSELMESEGWQIMRLLEAWFS